MSDVRIAVVGAGLIGRRHADAIAAANGVGMAAIADPSDAGRDFAEASGVRWHPTLEDLLNTGGVDGVLLATPNQHHAKGGLACVVAGLPVLVEKPIASDLASARRLVDEAEARGVALAVGHHRRHNPLIAKAKALLSEGRLGQIASVHGTTWFMKPDEYFEVEWRRRAGAGPVYLNLIHDIDLLQYFCGQVVEVQSMESNSVRGNEVEETAVTILRFASGVLGTLNISDTAVAPWSWELTARENPAYPATNEDCYWIAGTHGSLSLPRVAVWTHQGKRSWWEPISATRYPFDFADPLVLQAEQFGRVVRGEEPPLVSGRDGLAALEVVEAIKQAAETGASVTTKDAA
jgi:predicted dehydrogenase